MEFIRPVQTVRRFPHIHRGFVERTERMICMKKLLKVLAVAMACTLLFAACQKEEESTAVNTETTQQQTETKQEETKTEETTEAVDPKEAILAKAEEDKEAILSVMETVVDTYRSGTLPDYYEAYPAKESYPDLSSVDNITLEKGDSSCDVNVYVKVGEQNLCVSLTYLEGSENPWMVVKTAFGGVKG